MHPEQPADPTRRMLQTTTGPVAITEEGPADSELPVVLAVHGYPGSVRDWRWLAPALTHRVRLVRLDMPGFAGTPLATGPGTRIEDRGDFVLRVMDALELEQVALMSHSIGSAAILHAAAGAPERVSHLALLAPPGVRPHWGDKGPRMRLIGRMLGNPLGRAALFYPLRGAFIALGFSKHHTEAERTHTMRCAAATDFAVNGVNARQIRAPTLVAWATDDSLVAPDIVEELEALLPPGPRLAFDSGGHALQKYQANEIAEALLEFLASEAPTATPG